MSSGWTKLAGTAVFAACAYLLAAPEAGAVAYRCISGSGGTGSAALDLVHDGCVASKGDPFGVYSPPGGDSEQAVEEAIQRATNEAVDISLFGKWEGDSSLIDITPIKVKGDGGILTGEWQVLSDDVFVKYITVKAGTSYVLYELDGIGAQSGTFSTAALKNKGVSHISFWLSSREVEVPEPASIGLLGGGLLALGALARRKRA